MSLVSTHRDYHARAAAAHLLRHWSEDLPGAHSHFIRLANDEHPKVRLETVVSSTWADPSIAVVVLEQVIEYPQSFSCILDRLGQDALLSVPG